MSKKERRPVDEKMCRQVQLLLGGGATGEEAAEIVGVSTGTISRIRKAGFDMETFRKNTEERKEREKKAAEEPQLRFPMNVEKVEETDTGLKITARQPEEMLGQIAMDLQQAEEKPEMSDQVKLIRFLAGRFDALEKKIEASDEKQSSDVAALCQWIVVACTKIDKVNDYMGQILRKMDGR